MATHFAATLHDEHGCFRFKTCYANTYREAAENMIARCRKTGRSLRRVCVWPFDSVITGGQAEHKSFLIKNGLIEREISQDEVLDKFRRGIPL